MRFCHGEPDYHHILIGNGYVAVTEFNQMQSGSPDGDLYYFLRKVMEKHDWNVRLGRQIMETYERVLPDHGAGTAGALLSVLYPNTGSRSIFITTPTKPGCRRKETQEKIKNWRHSRRCARSLSAFFLVGNFRNRKFRMIPGLSRGFLPIRMRSIGKILLQCAAWSVRVL